MAARFTVLASGSAGNCTLLQTGAFGLLIDLGLGPRLLAARLAAVGASWRSVHAAILTHTHGDHWKDRTLAHLVARKIPLYCHADHHADLDRFSPAFRALKLAGLVRNYLDDCQPGPGLRVRPFPVRHDAEPTFAFRVDGAPDLFGPTWAVGYVADLGCWTADLVEALADVDVLAVEFNHDEGMQRSSGRPTHLIERVLGDRGHLSNSQGADLVQAVLTRSTAGRLRHVVQLHLSRECNSPDLAVAAAGGILTGLDFPVQVHTARQDLVGPILRLDQPARPPRRSAARLA